MFRALVLCDDDHLRLCIHLSFACSLRIGEILAPMWGYVDITEDSIQAGMASVFINKTLQRVDKGAMEALNRKDVIVVFPEASAQNRTIIVLKKPKTFSSVRKVFLPKTVAKMLIICKQEPDAVKEALGDKY